MKSGIARASRDRAGRTDGARGRPHSTLSLSGKVGTKENVKLYTVFRFFKGIEKQGESEH